MSTDLRDALARAAAEPTESLDVDALWHRTRRRRAALWGAAGCFVLALAAVPFVTPRSLSIELDRSPLEDQGVAYLDRQETSYETLAVDSPGIRAGALSYATSPHALAVIWDRYELPGDPPELDWRRYMVIALGSTGACPDDVGTAGVDNGLLIIEIAVRPDCVARSEHTTFALALPRDRVPGMEFGVTVVSPDKTHTTIAVDLLSGPATPIGAIPPTTEIGLGRFDGGESWPALTDETDLSATCSEVATILDVPLPFLSDPPAGLQPPDCYLDSINLDSPDERVEDGWFGRVLYLPAVSDPATNGLDAILDNGGLLYAVRRAEATEASPQWTTDLNNGLIAVEIGGSQGFIQSDPTGRLHVVWRWDTRDATGGVVLIGALSPDELVVLAQQTELRAPPFESN